VRIPLLSHWNRFVPPRHATDTTFIKTEFASLEGHPARPDYQQTFSGTTADRHVLETSGRQPFAEIT